MSGLNVRRLNRWLETGVSDSRAFRVCGRIANGELTEIETWSEQRSGDPLIEALKAPVAARFASFLGQPSIRATLTWLLAERQIVIAGRRGEEPFEEFIGR